MDASKCKALAEAIEMLTMAGQENLEEKKMKEVKKICRVSDEYVSHCFDLVWSQLKREHSEIRLSSFQIIDQLFRRSHKFRTLLLENFQAYLELTLEIDQLDNPLPPPRKAAETLKNSAYVALKSWHEAYSCGYKKLSLAYNYLRNCHQVDFNKAEHVSAVQRQREQEAKLQQETQRNARIDKIKNEITEHQADIEGFTLQLSTCFKLLLPSQDVFDAFDDKLFDCSTAKCSSTTIDGTTTSTTSTAADTDTEVLQEHGLLTRRSNVNINISNSSNTIVESEENTDIIHNLDEMKVLLTMKYLPLTVRWLQVLQKNGADQQLITQVIDIKQEMKKTLANLDVLKIERRHDEDSDDDADFVEVPEDIDEVTFFKSRLGMTGKPGQQPSTSKDSATTSHIPVLDYDLDLEYWENPQDLSIPETAVNDSSRFWINQDRSYTFHSSLQELYSSRKIDFSGKFEPVKWACRVPLPNGRLCPRMDRVKCPFHGEIIARTEDGTPENQCDAERLEKIKAKQRKEHPEWQDPSLLTEIQAQTGINLQVKNKKPTAKSNKSKLTDIKKPPKTARNRLESKVLSRKALKRVAGAMNSLENKKFKDRFCHSFNSTFAP